MHYFIQLSPFLYIYAIWRLQPHPHPLPVGEGSKYPCFLLEDGARRPPSYLVGASVLSVLSVFV